MFEGGFIADLSNVIFSHFLCSFSMFYSQPPYSDLIFQDATQQLMVLNYTQRNYARYLGKDFLRARRIVDCHAGAKSLTSGTITLVFIAVLTMLVSHS